MSRRESRIHQEDWYVQNCIKLLTGKEVTRIHRDQKAVELADGDLVPYDRLILATGADPMVPPIPGSHLKNVLTVRTVADADYLLEKLKETDSCVCVGGGLLGLGDTGYLHLTTDGLIVRLDDAKRQIEEDRAKQEREQKSNGVENGGPANTVVMPGTDSGNSGQTPPMPKPKKNTHFYGSIRVDPNKLGTTAGLISAEVLQHLNKLSGSHVTVTLDIQVDIPDGVPEDTARTVRENCRTLRFETSEFSED